MPPPPPPPPPPLQRFGSLPFNPPQPFVPTASSSSSSSAAAGANSAPTLKRQIPTEDPSIIISSSKGRPIQACSECKRRKIKCNRVVPCGPCSLRGDEATCREVEKVDPAQTFARVQEVDLLSNRVQTLEAQLQTLQRAVQGLQNGDTSPSNIPIDSPGSLADVRPPRPDDEEAALVLEDFALNHRQNRARATQRLNPGAGKAGGLNEGLLGEVRGISEGNPLAFFLPSGFDYLLRVVSALPDGPRSWALVQFYFARHEWYTKSLHAPSFLEEAQLLLSLSPYEAARQVRPEWLCCYLMVLCLALHLIDPEVQLQLGYSTQETVDLAKQMFSAAQAVLWASDFLSSHTLDHLQCIVLMGVYQFDVDDQSDAGWALLGSAIKVAQNLGLSRLGPETEARKRVWPEAWQSFRRREIARRVWWNLIMLDWSLATAHSATYAAHPSQNFTASICNVDDSMLHDSSDFTNNPLTIYTESSFLIFKCRFQVLYRELVDHLNSTSPASYPFILSMDMRLVQLMDSLPPFFRDPINLLDDPTKPNLLKESILLSLIAENRLLRLHRPYLTRGFRETKYAPSKDRCVQSARQILRLLDAAGERCPELLRFWVVCFYGFAAAIVVFLDHVRSPAEETRSILRKTLALLQTAEQISGTARNAIAMLEGLFAAEEEISNAASTAAEPSGQKRKRDEERSLDSADPFQKVVNRLLLAASSPGPRPETSPSVGNPSPSSTSALGLFDNLSPSQHNVFDFLAPVPAHQAELDLFVNGSRDENYGAGLGQLFSSDFGHLSELLQDYEKLQGVDQL